MTTSSHSAEAEAVTPLRVDLAGERVLAEVTFACKSASGFEAQVEAALGAVLELISTDAEIARLLCLASDSEAVTERQISWQKVFAAKLGGAAKRTSRASPSSLLLGYFIVGGILANLRRWLCEGDRSLPALSALLEFVLAYYPAARRGVRSRG